MGQFSTQQCIDLIDMYLRDLEQSAKDDNKTYIGEKQATQEDINAFFN